MEGRKGTSPRVWEKLQRAKVSRVLHGNFPAHVGETYRHDTLPSGEGNFPARVGSTSVPLLEPYFQWELPRACGEYNAQVVPRIYPCGNFPARVGSTVCTLVSLVHTWELPRACGEYSLHSSQSRTHVGTSPRVWGVHFPTSGNLFSFPNLASLEASKVRGFYCNRLHVTGYFDGFLLH